MSAVAYGTPPDLPIQSTCVSVWYMLQPWSHSVRPFVGIDQSPPPRESLLVFYDYAVRQIVRAFCVGEWV